MQEFTSVSASSYDPAALATKLTEKSAEGWSVVSIVPTGGDVTAFLARESSGAVSASAIVAEPAVAEAAVPAAAAATSTFAPMLSASAPAATPEPTPTPAPAVAEPAGWAMSPEPAATASTAPTTSMAPISEATTAYQAQPTASYQPQAAAQPAAQPVQSYQPAAATPAVPAGWYADPAGRFELRYWDGGTWTEHVSRAGQQFTDPPVA
jgi:hypothetical protein